jgi:hypothetical protein
MLRREIAFNHVKVGAADSARTHPYENFACAGLRFLDIDEGQRIRLDCGGRLHYHRTHGVALHLEDELSFLDIRAERPRIRAHGAWKGKHKS